MGDSNADKKVPIKAFDLEATGKGIPLWGLGVLQGGADSWEAESTEALKHLFPRQGVAFPTQAWVCWGAGKGRGWRAQSSSAVAWHRGSLCTSASSSLKWRVRLPLWLGGKEICLPVQVTQVRSLIWEDPTSCGAAKLVCHSYWASAPEPGNNYWAPLLQLPKPVHPSLLCNETLLQREALMLELERDPTRQTREKTAQPKTNK